MTLASEYLPTDPASLSAWTIFILSGVYLLTTCVKLRSAPGPLLSSVSDLPRLYWTLTKKQFNTHIDLHKKYGKLVRLGPNMVSVADPAAIPIIYGFTYRLHWTPLMSRFSKEVDSLRMGFQAARMAERQALAEKVEEASALNNRDIFSRLMEAQGNDLSLSTW